jgi:hypothetical protein
MVDVAEILQHWYAGRPKVEVARSLGGRCEDGPPIRGPGGGGRDGAGRPAGKRGAVAGAGPRLVPAAGPNGIRQVSWREIAVHHDRIAGLLPVVPVSVIHQRLALSWTASSTTPTAL